MIPPLTAPENTGSGLMSSVLPIAISGGIAYAGYEVGKQVFDLEDMAAVLLGVGTLGAVFLWLKSQGGFGINPMTGAFRTALPGIAAGLQ
jgi:hypothetical protein